MTGTPLFGHMAHHTRPTTEQMMTALRQYKLEIGSPSNEDTKTKYVAHPPKKVLEPGWEPEKENYDTYLVATKWRKKDGTIYYVRSFTNVHKIYATRSLKKRGSRVQTRRFNNEFSNFMVAQHRLNQWAKKAKMEPIGPKPQEVVNHFWKKED